ncbi:MAG: glycosyl hydrolase [Acidobacteriota bacterium]
MTRTLLSALTLFTLLGALGTPSAEARKKAPEPDSPATAVDEALLGSMEWREVGPFRGGRSAAVAGIPGDPNVFYFGGTGGGVWKTEDAGNSWTPVSDGYFGGSIGAVAVSEWDPNVIYVGGGEKTVRGNVSHGDGLWKSTDAGKTWGHIGLGDTRHVPRIHIHPRDPDLVYVAALGHLFGPNEERGVFRSKDGGETWENVLFVNEHAGAVDLAMDPGNPRVLYATFWRVLRTPWSLESGGEGSSMWKSTDGGDSWTEITRNPGLPDGTLGIMGITVSPTDSDNLYAIVEAEEGGVFRSKDGGDTWTRTNQQRDLRQRAWYYTRIYADPADSESVYVVNVRFHHSKDGGKTFRQIPTPHGDNHDLWIDPTEPRRMVQSNDGGANVSRDGGETWTQQANQPTAQMYRVSVDNDFPYRLLGGQQDNSSVRLRSRSAQGGAIGPRDWEPSAGCECGHIVAKPDDPDIVVGGCYGGQLEVVNHRTGVSRAVTVWPDDPMGWGAADLKYRFQWNFPIFFSPHDPNRLYTAAQVLFASDDLGHSWQPLSPDLTRDDKSKMGPSGGPITKDNTSVEYYGTIFAALESPHEPGVFWTGSDDGLVHLSRDGGETWSNVTPEGLPEWTQINGIEAHPFEKGGLYLAGTRYKLDDFRPYLYRTTDWGATWTDISDGLPEDHFTRAVRADPDRRGLLYAGTERGVHVSFDDGARWQPLQLNLPEVPITDLAMASGDLVAATQGRGFWILDDLSPLHQVEIGAAPAEHRLLTPRPAHRLVAGEGFFRGGGPNAGKNPPAGSVIHYVLAETDAAAEEGEETSAEEPSPGAEGDAESADAPPETKLEILDGQGEVLRTFLPKPEDGGEGGPAGRRGPDDRILETGPGAHRVVWDLRHEGPDDFPGMVIWNGFNRGPKAIPGTYRARLTVGDWSSEVDVVVEADPRSSADGEALEAQLGFLVAVRDKLSETHREIGKIRDVRAQIEGVVEGLGEGEGHAEAKAAAEALDDKLKAIEEALYQTQNQSPQDPLNFPIRLNDKLANLLGVAGRGDHRPTEAAEAVKAELFEAIDAQLEALKVLWKDDVPALDDAVRAIDLPRIAPKADDDA